MRIVLDALGSDNCPDPEVQAALQSAADFNADILLVGPADQLRDKLDAQNGSSSRIEIINAPDAITMEDKGIQLALKAKRPQAKNSMAIGIDLVKNGQADAFVTAGNTGGALATAYYRLGLIPGLERPALTALFPVKGGHTVVLDIGANPECKPEHLYQFAIMGSIYAQKVLQIDKPRLGLLSNGEEAGKGNQLIQDSYPLLEASGLNFIGNVEGKELFGGEADVVVMDGFTGNILLKSSEAVAKLLIDSLREELMSSFRTKVGAALAKPAFDIIKEMLDPAEVGAAPLLGVNGLVFIGHGRSNAYALVNAIRNAKKAVEADLLNAIQEAVKEQLTSAAYPGES
ncbi:MAG TPA: phosphate acyltransferase PlsX [Anaerolineales bacterium]|jgi:glycerol-3-phosphate acyltransferase PlsX|nr:phosphate acyltransferase PlsX [Anaerolineales bacterium]